ncbi:MAG: Rpn family recombination-promoting nuclease/putative transposase [Pseudomonadota bacterium]
MGQDHDASYKLLFSHPEMVRDLLTAFAPFPWARQLELAAFERVNASYVGDAGQQRHDDMVWRLRIGGEWLYVYLLLEFQSCDDHWMALRMQVYLGLLCQDLVRRGQLTSGGQLPPLLPIVLYSGAAPWRASITLGGLMLTPPPGLAPFQPRQRYLLIDQWRCRTARRGQARNLVATLFSLEHSRERADLERLLGDLAQWLRAPHNAALRSSVARWIAARLRYQDKRTTMMSAEDLSEVQIMVTQQFETWADQWLHEGRQEGLREGLKKGIQKGMQKGLEQGRLAAEQRRLASLLEKRFGPLPAPVGERIAAAPSGQIDRWFDRLFESATLEELLQD